MDFTHKAYKRYLEAIKNSYQNILRFDEFFLSETRPDNFCIIRHDIDREPKKALVMALIENELGIKSSYYFRAKKHTFKPDIIKKIAGLGHEIGYHYESFTDSRGSRELALLNFKKNLENFKKIILVKTIAMHGNPQSPYNNLALWREGDMRPKEVYLDIDYKDIAYITDTGRNWKSNKSNIRDKVDSDVRLDFKNGKELYNYLKTKPHPKMVFQVHPERWAGNIVEYCFRFCLDKAVNTAKFIFKIINKHHDK